MTANDTINLIISVAVAGFSLLIGGGWFIGLLLEPEKSEDFLLLVSFGLLLSGIGLTLNSFYLLTKKLYKWIYYTGLGILIFGYVLAFLGKSIYENF